MRMQGERFPLLLVGVMGVWVCLSGCATPPPEPSYVYVGLEEVRGADRQLLGYVRTEGQMGSEYRSQVIYDPAFRELGRASPEGHFYRSQGSELVPVGVFDKDHGLAKIYGARSIDVTTTSMNRWDLLASGPLTAPTVSDEEAGEAQEAGDE